MDHRRHYCLTLTDAERQSILHGLRGDVDSINADVFRTKELADRIERTIGEDEPGRLATRILEREYRASVQSMAEDVLSQALERADGNADRARDELSELAMEHADGSEWVIYTHQARLALVATDRPDEYLESFGEPAPTVEAAACAALAADVLERAGELLEERTADVDD